MQRKTTQRDAIIKVFETSAHPLTPTQVLAAARKFVRTLSLPTVYRNLNLLCRDGHVVAFHLPGDRNTYYERSQEHHHHFVCRKCGRLYRVDCLVENMSKLLPEGFHLEDHDVQLYGLCRACNRKRKTK